MFLELKEILNIVSYSNVKQLFTSIEPFYDAWTQYIRIKNIKIILLIKI